MDTTTTLQTLRGWPPEDRLELVFRLWDQLVEDGWQPQPTEELVAELDRRLAAHQTNPDNVRTWEQVRIHGRYHARESTHSLLLPAPR